MTSFCRRAAITLLLAVASAFPARAQATRSPATVALPGPLDRVLRDYEKGWSAGDAASLAALFADDGFVLQGSHAPVRGRDAIRQSLEGRGGAPLHLRAFAYSASDSIGFILGGYWYGDATSDQGKFTLTLRRDAAGLWKIFSDMDNSNLPPPPPKPAP